MEKAKRKEEREGKTRERKSGEGKAEWGREGRNIGGREFGFHNVFQKEEKKGNTGKTYLNKIITKIAPNFKKIFPSKYRKRKTSHIDLVWGGLRYIMLKVFKVQNIHRTVKMKDSIKPHARKSVQN